MVTRRRHLAHHRHRDGEEAADASRAVDPGGLVELARHALDRDHEEDRGVADRLPLAHPDDAPHGGAGFTQPRVLPRLEPEGTEGLVQQADLRVVEEGEEDARDRDRDDRGDEVDGPQDAAQPLVHELLEHRGQHQREAHLEDQRGHREDGVVAQRPPEDRVPGGCLVVVEPHEDGPRGERVPRVQAQPEVLDDGVVHEDQEQDQGGQHPEPRTASGSVRALSVRLPAGGAGAGGTRGRVPPATITRPASWPSRRRPGRP